MKKVIISYIFILLSGFVTAQSFYIQIFNVENTYHQGDSARAGIFVKLQEDIVDFSKAVIFLNVVEIDEDRRYPQAAHKIFASANIDHDIFKNVFSKEQLMDGVFANVNYLFKNGAKIAQYALVIQVFEGSNTNPHRLAGKRRLAFKAHNFNLIAR